MMNAVNSTLRRVPAWPIYVIGIAWAAWLFYLAATNPPTPEPIDWLENQYGELGLQLLLVGMMISPLRQYLGLNLLKFRRAIGVTAFLYVLAHFLVWAILDLQHFADIWQQIVKRPFITVGFAAFVLMIPLALTSNNFSVRKIGGVAWRKLHKLTYPAVLLGAVHYVWLSRAYDPEPYIYLAVAVTLVVLRYLPKRKASATA